MLTVIAVLILFVLFYRVYQAERDYDHRTQRDREAREERAHRREMARSALKRAIEFLNEPKYREMDYALGTGEQVRRAEKITAAKTWEEVETIACGEDLEIEKDKRSSMEELSRQDERMKREEEKEREDEFREPE